ncbi:MAG TPA: AIPR family protein [Phycisphaerae bacterium]|nr:AIPR family protein [Phycisphaerae bacterium]HRW55642.1 AIPR family protein [Phycisphaerae bacterium]
MAKQGRGAKREKVKKVVRKSDGVLPTKKVAQKKKVARRKVAKDIGDSGFSKPSSDLIRAYPVLEEFLKVDWKNVPLRQAYGVYALCLYANLYDYLEVAGQGLIDGPDDKDCDIVYIDLDSGIAFVVQTTISDAWSKSTASTNKADDILTAVSWLLKRDVEKIPAIIRPKAAELQDLMKEGRLRQLHLLYVHNSQESASVRDSLATVAESVGSLIQDGNVSVVVREIGLTLLQQLFNSLTKQIVVTKKQTFPVYEALTERGSGWSAIQTTISGSQLHDLYVEYGEELFSANIKGFLDLLNRKTSINRRILETVIQSPERFWAYNNGVTILSSRVVYRNGAIEAKGVSVINGAQTTGVLGRAPRESASRCRVPCRFITCSNPEVVDEIVANNNTQNEIKAFDIRSNDVVQKRLQGEFQKTGITYVHRRQGAQRLDGAAIQAEALAPFLAAFHGRFQTAFRSRKAIFEDRSIYEGVFPLQITAGHCLLVEALSVAVNNHKLGLIGRHRSESLTERQADLHEFMQYSTAKLFVVSLIGELAAQILDRPLPDRFSWAVAPEYINPSWRETLVGRWIPLVESVVPLVVGSIDGDKREVVRSHSKLTEIARKVGFQIESLKSLYDSAMSPIRDISDV